MHLPHLILFLAKQSVKLVAVISLFTTVPIASAAAQMTTSNSADNGFADPGYRFVMRRTCPTTEQRELRHDLRMPGGITMFGGLPEIVEIDHSSGSGIVAGSARVQGGSFYITVTCKPIELGKGLKHNGYVTVAYSATTQLTPAGRQIHVTLVSQAGLERRRQVLTQLRNQQVRYLDNLRRQIENARIQSRIFSLQETNEVKSCRADINQMIWRIAATKIVELIDNADRANSAANVADHIGVIIASPRAQRKIAIDSVLDVIEETAGKLIITLVERGMCTQHVYDRLSPTFEHIQWVRESFNQIDSEISTIDRRLAILSNSPIPRPN